MKDKEPPVFMRELADAAKRYRENWDHDIKEWEEAFAPYDETVNDFAKDKGLRINRFYHESPLLMIGRTQRINDFNVIWWNIQFCYKGDGYNLQTATWIDSETKVEEGILFERRLSPSEKNFFAAWQKGEDLNLKELLERAYKNATSLKEEDLTEKSSYIRGPGNVIKSVTP